MLRQDQRGLRISTTYTSILQVPVCEINILSWQHIVEFVAFFFPIPYTYLFMMYMGWEISYLFLKLLPSRSDAINWLCTALDSSITSNLRPLRSHKIITIYHRTRLIRGCDGDKCSKIETLIMVLARCFFAAGGPLWKGFGMLTGFLVFNRSIIK